MQQLLLRSTHAKSHRDRHDTLYFAFELSIRLAVAASPPPEPAGLARAGVGAWAAAVGRADEALRDERLLRLREHIEEVVGGVRSAKRSTTVRSLLQAIAAYRNRVIGHGSVRSPEFYAAAAACLSEGLRAAWDEGVFLPPEARWSWGPDDTRGHSLHITQAAQPGAPAPPAPPASGAHVLLNGRWRSLHPWVVRDVERERFWLFNGIGRRAEYLDYVSGDTLSGDRLAALDPELERAAFELFGQPDVVPADPAERDPNRVGDFRLLDKLGSGGMGVVYLARQESLGRTVALKLLPPQVAEDSQARARFRREVQALPRCDHPNVVKILTFGESRGAPYYAMEFVEGPDLAGVLRCMAEERRFSGAVERAWSRLQARRGVEPARQHGDEATATPAAEDGLRELARYVRDAALGLDHLHQRGILHRDISPANLMVTWPERRAVLMDLGLAAIEDASVSLSRDEGKVVGTLRYLSPEQLVGRRSEVDERSDVYSLGAVLFELVCGRPLNDGEGEASIVHQILDAPTPRPRQVRPDLPRDLATIVTKATERERHLRYPSASALADDLDAWLNDRPISARPPTPAYLFGLAVRRNKGLSALALTALLAVVGGLAGVAWTQAQGRREIDLSSDTYRLPYLLEQADERLWPCTMEVVPSMERWLKSAEALLDRRVVQESRLVALPAGSSDDERRSLQELVDGLETLRSKHTEVLARVEFARMTRHRLEVEDVEAWSEAIRSIADVDECPAYGGLQIVPQEGLVPIGRDSKSGLWEFSHLQSGSIAQRDADGAIVLQPQMGIVLVLLPQATFWMGSQREWSDGMNYYPDSPKDNIEYPPNLVTLDAFFLSKYEMTQFQWEYCTGSDPSEYPSNKSEPHELRPVERISQLDAIRVMDHLLLTLPTEAQWEFAARAGVNTPWPTGTTRYSLSGYANVSDLTARAGGTPAAETVEWNDFARIHGPVGCYEPNAFGLYDTLGNVWEWCLDGFVRYVNPAGPVDGLRAPPGVMVVARGGSWATNDLYARSAYRYRLVNRHVRNDHGVRPARKLQP